jgi:hypothetical protein
MYIVRLVGNSVTNQAQAKSSQSLANLTASHMKNLLKSKIGTAPYWIAVSLSFFFFFFFGVSIS